MATSITKLSYEEEKRKNPELTDVDIQSLREWHQKQPHLPSMTDAELALFLHSNYYRIEPTKATIETFYTIRTHVPEFFANRDPINSKDFKQIIQCVANIGLKDQTKDGYNILYSALIDFDTSKYDYTYNMKLTTMVSDLWMREIGTMKGHVTVVEIKGLAMGHLTSFSPMALKKFLVYLQDGLPVRLKAVHFLNTNPVMDIILNMMKPFMKKELMDILHFHSTPKSIEEHGVPLDILPNESGGKAGTIKDLFNDQLNMIRENRDWYMAIEKHVRVDESKRLEKSKGGDLFGVEGSFKKLDID